MNVATTQKDKQKVAGGNVLENKRGLCIDRAAPLYGGFNLASSSSSVGRLFCEALWMALASIQPSHGLALLFFFTLFTFFFSLLYSVPFLL